MSPETLQYLEFIITIAAIVGAVWHLDNRIDSKIAAAVKQVNDKITDLKDDINRLESRFDARFEKMDGKLDRLREDVNDGNQRLARLEGRFEGREERLATEGEADATT